MKGTWSLADGTRLELDITAGKPLDVLALKGSSLDDVRSYSKELEETAARLYPADAPRETIASCPCCEHPSADAPEVLVVYGIGYARCPNCGHAFVREQPGGDGLAEHFSESEELSGEYTDAAAAEGRIEQIVAPKLEWVLDVFRRQLDREPGTLVDVGAGGGHFVAGAQRAGVDAQGFEISRASRAFAAEVFDVELRDEDFLESEVTADLITFWGLLEYTPRPRDFLAAARRALGDDGLLVVEVPRFDCLGTAAQARFPDTVARHLDPTSHVNCFSDTSLATALDASGFRPVAAWYFGMDAYELAVQLALRLGEERLSELVELLLPMQQSLDEARYCDDLVVAAVPA
jgi:SAM-dependent methyltransferase